ncbi:hypothetical protein [Geomicrobium sp. JCM 19038]|uniref:hypothetical protein n=1 Tax=Geomicrobium sp. JCM 19038 TaxID=1460635 RepID=UPI000A4648C6|nr:hypothetical protein [Geomicrobium sp. JCM 19038]
MDDRVISKEALTKEEEQLDQGIRPLSFADYIGQEQVKKNLQVFIQAAKLREES